MPLAAVAGIGAIGSIAGGIIGSNAAGHAADTQAAAANNAANLQHQDAQAALDFNKQQYGNSLSMLSPYYNMGTASLGRLGFLMGLNPGQGLPAGVINPNAQQSSDPGASAGVASSIDKLLQGAGGFNRGANQVSPGRGGIPQPFTAQNSGMLPAGQNPFQNNPTLPGAPTQFNMNNPITSPGTNGTQFQMNPPITSPGTGGTQFQMNPPITSPGQGGAAALNGGTGVDTSPFPNGLGNLQNQTTASTNQGGTGQVPVNGGGTFNMQPPITSPMMNPNDPNQGTNPAGGGGFGSLAQNFGEQWKSPTGVTEVNDPGYQFRINQGLQALQNSAAARGKLVSGDTAKGLNDYAQNSASGEFQNVYNRALNDYTTRYNAFNQDQNTQFNRFATLAGLGQTSAGQLANVGLSTAGNNSNILLNSGAQIGQDYQNAGAARASGYVGSANAISGGINGASNIAMLLAMMKNNPGATDPNAGMGVF